MSSEQIQLDALRDLLAEILDVEPEEITEDAHFVEDLEVDSLMALEVMVRLEKTYGVKIVEKELAEISCLRNVHGLLTKKGAFAPV